MRVWWPGLKRSRPRRLPVVAGLAALLLAIAPVALAAAPGAGTATTSGQAARLPAELARAHAEALSHAPSATASGSRPRTAAAGSQAAVVAALGTVSAIGGEDRLAVSWTKPPNATPGIASISVVAYDVAVPAVAAGSCAPAVSAYNCSIGGLVNGHQYTVRITSCDLWGACALAASAGPTTAARWPDPVTNLLVSGGNDSVTASWTPPASNGGLAVDHYYVTIFPDGSSWCYPNLLPLGYADVTSTHVTFNAATLAYYGDAPVNGHGYRVTVWAVNDTVDGYTNGNDDCYPNAGFGQDVTSSAVIADPVSALQSGQAGQYTPVQPVALLGASGTSVGAGAVTEAVLGHGAIPTSGVSAVTLGVSARAVIPGQFLYVWNADAAKPADPTLVTSTEGSAVTVTVPVGSSGEVSVSATTTATVNIDVLGYYQDGSIPRPGSQYVGVSPATVFNGMASVSAAQSVNGTPGAARGASAIVRAGATAVVVDVTASAASVTGSLTLSGSAAAASVPDAPALYYTPGRTKSAVTTVALASDGTFQMRASAGYATVSVSIIGYYTGPQDPAGGDYLPAAQTYLTWGHMASGATLTVPWPGSAPAAGSVLTEWLLVFYTSATGWGPISVYPTGASPSTAVTVDIGQDAGQVLVPVPRTAADGSVIISSGGGNASLQADVVGYTLQGVVPSAPSAVQATPLASGANISWNPPCSYGAAPVSGYTITASPGGQTITADGSATSAFMYGLTDGVSYNFTVAAISSAGQGPGAQTSVAVTPAPTVPDTPDPPAAQAGDGSALVSWDPPDHNGDSAITGYTVTASPGNIQATAGPSARQVVVTGLANGTAYSFSVTAVNANGSSNPSPEGIAVTPAAGQAIGPAIRTTAAILAAGPKPVTTCSPIARLGHASTSASGGTVTQYQLAGHTIRDFLPPAGFDPGTASLASLHRYGLATTLKNTRELRAWQRHLGHTRVVSFVPCVGVGSNAPRSGTQACYLSSVQDGGGSYGPNWAGLVTDAPDNRPPDPAINMKTANPFEAVEGSWTVGTFQYQGGLADGESSWVGLGGADGAAGLIQAGTAQFNALGGSQAFFWTEILSSWWDDTGMVPLTGFPVHPGDVVDVYINVFDPWKVFPKATPPPSGWNPDPSWAEFLITDKTTGQSGVFQVTSINQEYDGSTAEWIDEDPTTPFGGLFTLPAYSYIYWNYGYAWGADGNQGEPTDAGVWPVTTKQQVACVSLTPNCSGVNNAWRKSYMVFPNSNTTALPNGKCEAGVSQIYYINEPSEMWYTYWAPNTVPVQQPSPLSCPVYKP